MDLRCETCRYWDTSVSSGDDDKDRTGRCAVAPPSVDDRTGRGLWPITDADDYCYEWESDELAKTPVPVRCETCRDDPRGIDQRLGGRGAAMLNGWTRCPDCATPGQPGAGAIPSESDEEFGEELRLVYVATGTWGLVAWKARRLLAPRLTEEVVEKAIRAFMPRFDDLGAEHQDNYRDRQRAALLAAGLAPERDL